MRKLTSILAFAAISAAAYAPLAGSSEKGQAMRSGPPPSASILLAHGKDVACVLDGRRVPVGSSYCHRGKVKVCNGAGAWADTGKAC